MDPKDLAGGLFAAGPFGMKNESWGRIMGEIIKIAFRNIRRHKRRSILTGMAMLVGAFTLTFSQAYGTGVERQLITNMIASDTGHILITAHRQTKGSDLEEALSRRTELIPSPLPLLAELDKQPGIDSVTQQLNINGMISNGIKMKQAQIIGIEPGKEQELLHRVIPAVRGRSLQKSDHYGIYISRTVAATYQVTVGDVLTVIAQSVAGQSNAMDFIVKGVFDSQGSYQREQCSYILLDDAQTLIQTGSGVNQIKVMLSDPGVAGDETDKLRQVFARKYNIDFTDWRTAGKFFFGVVLALQVFNIILCIVLFIVAAVSVMNTTLMSVYGRIREIGTMMALGTRRYRIIGLFVTEAMLLGMIAAGLGVLLGSGAALWTQYTGIPAFTESMKYAYGGNRAYPYLTIGNICLSYLVIVLLAVGAALYPAIAAARMRPVEALTRNQ